MRRAQAGAGRCSPGRLVRAALLCGGLALLAPAAHASPGSGIGIQLRAYPAGLIPAAKLALGLGPHSAFFLYGGYNLTDRRDFGKHDNEEGGGPGFGLAWRTYFGAGHSGWHAGLRADLWFLDIDWEDGGGTRTGTTDITVLQPTAQAGYTHAFSGGRLAFEATAALGMEINIRTAGEAVGEGLIFLLGLGLQYRF